MNHPEYDTIVIGSGAGGLAAAVALSKAGHRVLVCEQHGVPGGWLHSFTMEGYRFNTGVHYIGDLATGERFHRLFQSLGILDNVEFLELNPDGYDHIFLGYDQFDIPKGKTAYRERLKELFPQERKGIEKLFKKITQINSALLHMVDEEYAAFIRYPTVLPWLFRTGQSLIHAYVQDPQLRGILLAQCGNHGMPPSQVSAIVHAGIMAHYFEGGYHPRGGGMAIARAFVRALKRNGGEIRLNSAVKQIILEKNKAVGIELESGERIHAAHIISNADPYITFTKLVGSKVISPSYQRKLDRLSYSTSCLSLYLAVDLDLPSLGIDSGNYWYYDSTDIDLHYRRGLTDYNIYNPPSALFVTCTSIKDPGKRHHGRHQIEAFTFCHYEPFSKWKHLPSGARDEQYQQLKTDITQRMLSVLEKRIPGIREKIAFSELGTPLTNVHYLQNHLGNMYGIAKSVKQSGPLAFHPETKFENLFLCGASTMGHGVAYSANTGITAASRILKCKPTSLWKYKF